jgi:branched-chain amino acid transport system substrate-binding protein
VSAYDRRLTRRQMLQRTLGMGGIVVVGFSLEACGSSASSSGNSGSGGSAAKTFKLGLATPLTGLYAEPGQNTLLGAQVAADLVNSSQKKVNVQVISADTAADPQQAADATNQLISQGAQLIHGCYASALTLTATTAAEQQKVPFITNSFENSITQRGYQYTYQLPPLATALGANAISYFASYAKSANLGAIRAAIVSSNDVGNVTGHKAAVAAAQKAGFDVVLSQYFATDADDFTSLAAAIRDAKPSIVFYGSEATNAQTLLVDALRGVGVTAPISGLAGGEPIEQDFIDNLGAAKVDGVLDVSAWNGEGKNPAFAALTKAYLAKKGKGVVMPQEAGEAAVTVYLIVDAITAGASSDAAGLQSALKSTTFGSSTRSGAIWPTGTIKFDSAGLNTGAVPVWVEWISGQLRTIGPPQIQVATPVISS